MIFTFPGLSADLPFDMFVDLETFIGTLGAVGVFNHDFTKTKVFYLGTLRALWMLKAIFKWVSIPRIMVL